MKALFDVSITAVDGEFLVLLGPSGSGKTTFLRAIAGLESLDAGDIFIGDRCVTRVDPGARNIGMVFQDYALYPHMTVRGNIAYNMRLRGVAKAEMQRRTNEVAAMLRLESLLDRRPAELSGGQRQRVALGRAITRDSAVLLMDEPLSNLDAQIREHVRVELRELQRRIGVTTIYVTLDQVEAMVIADRIAVMSNARIEQVGSPETIYDRPQTLFCARFVGSPQANEVRGVLRWTGEKHSISLSRQRTARLGCASSSTPTRLICRANRRKFHRRVPARGCPAALRRVWVPVLSSFRREPWSGEICRRRVAAAAATRAVVRRSQAQGRPLRRRRAERVRPPTRSSLRRSNRNSHCNGQRTAGDRQRNDCFGSNRGAIFGRALMVKSFTQDVSARDRRNRIILNREPADLVIRGGQVLDVHTSLIKQGGNRCGRRRIAYVGEVEDLIGPQTTVVDADRPIAIPGLIEGHIHTYESHLPIKEIARDSSATA